MIRLLWLLIVGSWRFPWEKKPEPKQLPPPKSRLPEYHWEDIRDECGHESRADERDIVRECNGAPSEWCSAGRCRVHCAETCKCETTRPDAPGQLVEAPREPKPPISTGAAYR